MSGGEGENKSSYFFHKSLKDLFKNNENSPFSVVGKDSHNETESPSCSSKLQPNSKASGKETIIESFETKKLNSVDVKSWKECFFFSKNDDRLRDGVMFFKGDINSQNNLQFNEVRKKLKQSIRHKMLKRRSLAVKRKFNKRNLNRFVYKKVK